METFSSFSYLVRNDFIYKDKVEVRVFFIYLDKGVVNKSLFLDKVNNKPERLYIADAKKIVNKMIANGALEKYAKENIKHTKHKKMGIAFASVMISALALGGIATGAYFLLHVPTYEVTIPEINGLSIDIKKIKSGEGLEASLTVNPDLTSEILPIDLTSVKVGKNECEYTYTPNSDYLGAVISIDGSFIRNNVTIELSLRERPWYLDKDYIKGLKKEDINNGDGVIKTIEVNGQQHKVRLIGVDEDEDANGNPIHTTWEFANLISDSNGYYLATQWNDTNDTENANTNYLDSSIRKALNGTGGATHFLWAESKADHWSTTYKEPVINMLPKDLVANLNAPRKMCCCKNLETDEWEEKVIETAPGVYDKLFLLSPREMGRSEDALPGHTYSYYYPGLDEENPKLAKYHTAKSDHQWIESIGSDKGQTYEGSVSNYAGRQIYGGGRYWLRMPYYSYFSIKEFASFVSELTFNKWICYPYSSALGIAPAFCL